MTVPNTFVQPADLPDEMAEQAVQNDLPYPWIDIDHPWVSE